MGSINIGSQVLTFDYKGQGSSQVMNRLLKDIVPQGLYTHPTISINSNSEVSISPFVAICYDEDANVAVRVETTLNSVVGISSVNPYLVLTFTWVDTEANYADFAFTNAGALTSNMIILGKGVYDGATLTSIDYSEATIGGIIREDRNGKVLVGDISIGEGSEVEDIQVLGDTVIQGSLYVKGQLRIRDQLLVNDENYVNTLKLASETLLANMGSTGKLITAPAPTANGFFGQSVALINDEIFSGTGYQDEINRYVKDDTDVSGFLHKEVIPSPEVSPSNFSAVMTSNESKELVIASDPTFSSEGRVYVFSKLPSGDFTNAGVLDVGYYATISPPVVNTNFGQKIASYGDYLVIADDNNIYFFKYVDETTWTYLAVTFNYTEVITAVEISDNYVFVGTETANDNDGAVYVYARTGDSLALEETLVHPNGDGTGTVYGSFGHAISVNEDETTLVVGAPLANGEVVFYNRPLATGLWSAADIQEFLPNNIASSATYDGYFNSRGLGQAVAISGNIAIILANIQAEIIGDHGTILYRSGGVWRVVGNVPSFYRAGSPIGDDVCALNNETMLIPYSRIAINDTSIKTQAGAVNVFSIPTLIL